MSHLGHGVRAWCLGCIGTGGIRQRFARVGQALPQPTALDFDEQLPESLAVIGLLVAVAATNLIFLCPRRRRGPGGACSDEQHAGLAAGGAEEQCAGGGGQAARVDTLALTGLRGLAALHVACGHYSDTFGGPDLFGGASMSFFYLLSGFVMTLGYARPAKAADGSSPAPGDGFDTKRFLRNRFARLYPSYLLTTLIGLGLTIGLASLSPALLSYLPMSQLLVGGGLSVLGVNMWLYPLNAWILDPRFVVGMPSNPVAWTVQTMALFYLLFPTLLPWLRCVRNRRGAIVGLYWLQLVTFMSAMVAGIVAVHKVDWGYWVARSWPLSRFSVFAMGCLMAFERSRGDGAGRSMCLGLWCGARDRALGERAWGQRATRAAVLYLLSLIAGMALVQLVASGGFVQADAQALQTFYLIRGGLEAAVPLLFVDLIGALTRCGSEGVAAKLCRSVPLQRLGDISMTFYMTHLLVVSAAELIWQPKPGDLQVAIPKWLAPILFCCALAMGWLLTHYFEAPVRRALRG